MGSYESGQYSLGYIDPTDVQAKDLKQMQDHFYQANYTANSVLWMQGSIDMRFQAGDQALYNMALGNQSNLSQYQKFFLNLTRRHTDMIEGYQRRNRKSTITLPLHEADDALADDYNTCLRWSEDRDGYQEYHSQAFAGAVAAGFALEFLYPDYTFDPISGDLFTDCVTFQNVLMDQHWRKMDFSDCNGVWRRRWTSKEGAKLLLPGYAKEIDRMKPGGMKDGRFPVQAELQNIQVSNLFTYDEFHYRTTRPATIVLDPKSGEAVEWEEDEEDEEDMMERTLAQQPWLVVKKVQVPTVKLVLSLGGKIVYHGKNLLNIDEYPCAPMVCYHQPDMQQYALRCMGKIRNMRDAQFLYNMRKVIELSILQSQINSGWIYPVDVVTDVKAFRQTGEGLHIPIKAGRSVDEVKRLDPVAIPQSLLELSASLAEDITKISGVNEELLGAAQDDKSGILSMLRQGAGLTTLQTIFDKCDYTQRIMGKIRLQAIRKNFSKGKIRNILGHDPDPRFFSSHSQKYSVAVEEGNYSATQRQTELQQLLYFKELGMPIANKTIMRVAFISNKKQAMQEMAEESQQQQQQAMQQAQLAQKESDAKVMGQYAKSKVDMARVIEIQASTQEKLANVGKIEASAEHEQMQADYELVEMMMKLEDMQMGQVKASFELAQAIKAANQPKQLTQQTT